MSEPRNHAEQSTDRLAAMNLRHHEREQMARAWRFCNGCVAQYDSRNGGCPRCSR